MHTSNLNKLFLCCSVVWLGSLSSSLANNQPVPLPTTLLELQHSPSPYECAVLSAHVYQKDIKPGDSVVVTDEQSGTTHPLKGWQVLQVFEDSPKTKRKRKKRKQPLEGYKGVIYRHAAKKQLVLAHRGTVLNAGAIKTDALAIAQNIIAGQERLMPKMLQHAINLAEKEGYSLTTTGHSLGGWLAQVTAFLAKDHKKYRTKHHVKAITFDTPGARPMLEQMNPKNDSIDLDQLDITNYLSSPNLINACNPHVGTLYRVVFSTFPETLQYSLASHTMSNFLQAFDLNTGREKQCVLVCSWPLISKEHFKSLTKGLTRIFSGNILEAIGNFLAALRAHSRQEFLGQYSGFFKFAHQTNHYHPDGLSLEEDSPEEFELKYKYHYHTEPFAPHVLRRRHIPVQVQQFMANLRAGVVDEQITIDQEVLLADLQWQPDALSTTSGTDIRPSVDLLMSVAWENPSFCTRRALIESAITSKLVSRSPLAPPPITFFVGRAAILNKITRAWQGKQKRTIHLIAGPGGIGKSQVATRLFHQQADQGAYDHVFWMPGDSKEKLISTYLGIADDLGIHIDKKNIAQTVQHVRRRLQDKHCLYVFDDAPSSKAIEDFMPLKHGHVLITSRNSAAGSWTQEVQQQALAPFGQEEVLALAQQFNCSLKAKDTATLQYLVENMSGYPLTLAQFFSLCQTQGYIPKAYVRQLSKSPLTQQDKELLQLLAEAPEGRVHYNHSMLQVFRTSLQKLTKARQGTQATELLSKLAYLDPKSIPVDWILTFFPEDKSLLKRETRHMLALLERYSFIQWDRETGQVYMHAVTQLMARHLYSRPILASLTESLIAYAGNAAKAHNNLSRWTSLLLHGSRLYERLQAKNDQVANKLTEALAKACEVRCLYDEACAWLAKNLVVAKMLYLGESHPDVARSLHNLGRVHWSQGRYAQAKEVLQQALNIYKAVYSNKPNPDVTRSLNQLGDVYRSQGHYAQAAKMFQQSLKMYKAVYGNKPHLDVATSFHNLGLVYLNQGQYAQAGETLQQSLKMYKVVYGNKATPFIIKSFHNLGLVYRKQGHYAWAEETLRQALKMCKAIYGNKPHPLVGMNLNNLGLVYWRQGQYAKVEKVLQQALKVYKAVYGDKAHPLMAKNLINLGLVYRKQGHYARSEEISRQALKMQKAVYGDKAHQAVAYSYYYMGELYRQHGMYQEAADYYKKARNYSGTLLQQRYCFGVKMCIIAV